jgi:hypothetical protein
MRPEQEPQEFGNFKRIDNDFHCTADNTEMLAGSQPLFLWAAYEITRVQAVMTVRKEGAGKLDLERIRECINGITAWVPRLGEIAIKAKTVRRMARPSNRLRTRSRTTSSAESRIFFRCRCSVMRSSQVPTADRIAECVPVDFYCPLPPAFNLDIDAVSPEQVFELRLTVADSNSIPIFAVTF